MGLVDDARWSAFAAKREAIDRLEASLDGWRVHPGTDAAAALERASGVTLARDRSAADLVRMPEVTLGALLPIVAPGQTGHAPAVVEQVETRLRYAGYLDRQQAEIDRSRANEDHPLPDALDYADVHGLSHEVRQKLAEHRPSTVGQASRVPGVTPAAISLLLVHLKRMSLRASA